MKVTGYVCLLGEVEAKEEVEGTSFRGTQIGNLHLCHPEWRVHCPFLRHTYRGWGCYPVTVTIEAGEPTSEDAVQEIEQTYPVDSSIYKEGTVSQEAG